MIRHTEINKTIGRNVRKFRRQKGLMQIDVAVAVNLDRTYVSRIETGQARITLNLLFQLVKGLEISSSDLILNQRGDFNYGSKIS
ncbi:MAG TPA: helix-turn-helix domain-containing protein [Candidatus Wunengus sp. YC60]|uniref:helix-turn-helix domain-containing protein n=1 Tax=Candidatus Wunengus sp. YC60 TaxID=3367697 RepID=UPI004028F778